MLLLLNHLPSLQVLMALSRKTDARDTTVKWICMTLTCLAPHSQACWRDFTFRLPGFKEGSTLMKANFRLDLPPNHPEEQTDGSPPPPPFQIQYQATLTQKATAHAFFKPVSFVRRHLFGWKMAYCWMPTSEPKVY